MKKKTINASTIAKLAGVSRSTVSKVINGYNEIPEKTRLRVLDIINKHNYEPDVSGKMLRGFPQSVIALYIYAYQVDVKKGSMSGLDTPYVMGVISSFIRSARKMKHKLQVELIEYDDDTEIITKTIQKDFYSKIITGAVFVGLPETRCFVDDLIDEGFNIALLDRDCAEKENVFSVCMDEVGGCQLGLSTLLNNGYKFPCFIGGNDDKRSARLRKKGFIDYCKSISIDYQFFDGDFSFKSGQNVANHISKMPYKLRPDCFIFASSTIGHGFIKCMQVKDSNYLSTIGMVGFDDSDFNEIYQTPLAALKHDFETLATRTIIGLLETKIKKDYVPFTLISRTSINRLKSGKP